MYHKPSQNHVLELSLLSFAVLYYDRLHWFIIRILSKLAYVLQNQRVSSSPYFGDKFGGAFITLIVLNSFTSLGWAIFGIKATNEELKHLGNLRLSSKSL